MQTRIRSALASDAPILLSLIRDLAIYEKLEHEVVATVEDLQETLFQKDPAAEVLLLEEIENQTVCTVGFALYFQNYSTFLGKPGIYLEDLFVLPEKRGRGYGKRLLATIAKMAIEKNCGRVEWSVLDWNQSALDFYRSIGAKPQSEWTVQRLTGVELMNLAKKV